MAFMVRRDCKSALLLSYVFRLFLDHVHSNFLTVLLVVTALHPKSCYTTQTGLESSFLSLVLDHAQLAGWVLKIGNELLFQQGH